MKKHNTTLEIAAIIGAITVIIGAFGAHGLRPKLSPESFNSFETAVKYQFYHVLVLLFIGLYQSQNNNQWLDKSVKAFVVGILLFSGSIYFLSTKTLHQMSIPFIGIVTPIGGVFFILGWFFLWLAARKE